MSAQTEKAGPSYLEPWFRYQEMLLDFWNGLFSRRYHSRDDVKSVQPKPTSHEGQECTTDQPAATGHLYHYDKFLKYWNINNDAPSRRPPTDEADTGPSGHDARKSQSDSEVQPYDAWYEYYLSLVRGTDRYLALWKSASDTFINIQSHIPEERPPTMTAPFRSYQETWQKMIAWLVMPLPGLQKPEPTIFDYFFPTSGVVRFWTDLLGTTATNTWMSLLKKDIDHLIYETNRMKEMMTEFKNQNQSSHGREGVMNEIVAQQRDAAARTMILAGEMAAVKTALHDLRSALKKQDKAAHHAPKDEKGQLRSHA